VEEEAHVLSWVVANRARNNDAVDVSGAILDVLVERHSNLAALFFDATVGQGINGKAMKRLSAACGDNGITFVTLTDVGKAKQVSGRCHKYRLITFLEMGFECDFQSQKCNFNVLLGENV